MASQNDARHCIGSSYGRMTDALNVLLVSIIQYFVCYYKHLSIKREMMLSEMVGVLGVYQNLMYVVF